MVCGDKRAKIEWWKELHHEIERGERKPKEKADI